MNKPSLRFTFLLVAFCCLTIGLAYAGDYPFPSANSFYCNSSTCGFVGDNGNQTAPFYTAGDFVTEILFNGPSYVKDMSFDFFLLNNLGGNPGSQYTDYIYVNSALVGSFQVTDCNYCGSQQEYKGTFSFDPIYGDGTYALSIVLGETVPLGDGNEIFLAPGSVELIPEPSAISILGSAVFLFAGLMRLKLFR